MASILYKDGEKHLVKAEEVAFLLSEGYSVDKEPKPKRKKKAKDDGDKRSDN